MLDPDRLPSEEQIKYLRARMRNVPDFPKPGILFKDLTPLLADARAFQMVIDLFGERFVGDHIDVVVGIEARGFLFAAPLALRLNASLVLARKPGKLPAKADRVSYALEYGEAELDMHVDSITRDARVLVVDDLLATGGTASAAAELARRQGGNVVAFAFAVELTFLGGRARLADAHGPPVCSLVRLGAGE